MLPPFHSLSELSNSLFGLIDLGQGERGLNIAVVKKEARAWQEYRNNKNAKVNWQFTTEGARIKLSRLYPTLES